MKTPSRAARQPSLRLFTRGAELAVQVIQQCCEALAGQPWPPCCPMSPSDFEVTPQEEKRLRGAIAGILPGTEPFERGSSPDEMAEHVLEVVRTTNPTRMLSTTC